MTDEPNNPPAFPRGVDPWGCVQDGMSLRDYFAGQALAALLSEKPGESIILTNPRGRDLYQWMAEDAYHMADAMLLAREPKDTTTAQQITLGIGGGK